MHGHVRGWLQDGIGGRFSPIAMEKDVSGNIPESYLLQLLLREANQVIGSDGLLNGAAIGIEGVASFCIESM